MEELKTKKIMTAAERKRKSRENKFKNRRNDVQRDWERKTKKSCSNSSIKKKNSMTPEDLKDYKKKEAFRIKALRNMKVSTEHSNKEKAKAILKVTKTI